VNYGLYMSAAGVLTNMHQMDVAANNLANVETTGFKKSLVGFHQQAPESQQIADGAAARKLLDRLGGAVNVQPSRIDASGGSLVQTGNPLDLAIEGTGFFAVQVPGGATPGTWLTRDGRLTMASDGRLVTSTGGHAVVDSTGAAIELNPTEAVTVDGKGQVRQGGGVVATLQMVAPPDASRLRHMGHGLYQAPDGASLGPAEGRVVQGHLEQSNVDPIQQMLRLIEASGAITRSGNLIRYNDRIMDQAINTLGRVA